MTTPHADETESSADRERVHQRAGAIPEETAAGADDPQAQARAVLADSDDRVEDPEGTRADSSQTPGPDSDS